MTVFAHRQTISTLPEDPQMRLCMVILDHTEEMEPHAGQAYDELLTTMLTQKNLNRAVSLTIYQGDYLECYHEDHLRIEMIDSMPIYRKSGGASRAITYVLESLLRRNAKSAKPLHVDIVYIGAGHNSRADQALAHRRDRAIKIALALNWTFKAIAFKQSLGQCEASIGFDLAHRQSRLQHKALTAQAV